MRLREKCNKKVGRDRQKCECGQVQYCSSKCQAKHLNASHKDECRGPPEEAWEDDQVDLSSSESDNDGIFVDTRTKAQRKMTF